MVRHYFEEHDNIYVGNKDSFFITSKEDIKELKAVTYKIPGDWQGSLSYMPNIKVYYIPSPKEETEWNIYKEKVEQEVYNKKNNKLTIQFTIFIIGGILIWMLLLYSAHGKFLNID
jgi:hypothetical protein